MSDAAKESNLPSRGLPGPASFEDWMGHQARAAPGVILRATRERPPHGVRRWAGPEARAARQPAVAPRPCSSAPLTAASSALSRYSASASALREAPARRRRRPVVAEHAVQQREPALLVERARARSRQHPLADHQVAEQPALLGQPDLGAVGELARAAEVVDDRGGQQQVGVQARVQLAELVGERRHRDRVLEQAAEVGVVAATRARRAAQRGAQPPSPSSASSSDGKPRS